ncbi:MAG TPA: aldehyde dehydrogenase family protein [Acidobacteriota bacterium]|nr:aldehyde dehydrogenase family protein [Acidobacteriota bacterium]
MKAFPILIDGEWRPARCSETFRAINPATGEELPGDYPISLRPDIDEAIAAGKRAARGMASLGPEPVARFLEALAGRIEGRRSELVETARAETSLPAEPRLGSVELPRMLDQLRQAAAACRGRSWCRATIDTKAEIRSMHGPLGGPVVIMGPNNFPYAYNALGGGDFASALAAGNPVIAKAHPGHPATTRILAEEALDAGLATGMPHAAVQLLYHFAPGEGLRLVAHRDIGATAFTGSRPSGLALKKAADEAGKPIYLEMSSANPVFILPGALDERSAEVAAELYQSCSLAAGQMCTKPGLVVVPDGPSGRAFIDTVRKAFEEAGPAVLLGPKVLQGLQEAMARLVRLGAKRLAGGREPGGPGIRFFPALFGLNGTAFLEDPASFQVEAFGTLSVIVAARDTAEMREIAAALDGHLTGSIYSRSDGGDDGEYGSLEPILRTKVGRLLNDRMPTGVAVSPAMNHGGPYPATGHPGFTAVGFPAAILRFTGLRCYDHVRADRLPPELRDENPTGSMWRFIDGEWTRRSI